VPGSVDYLISLFGFLFEAAVVVLLVRRHCFGRYFVLGLYMAASFVFGITRYLIVFQFGLRSDLYFYFYYYSDGFLTICLYFVLMSLFLRGFEDMGIQRYVRVGALLLLAGTAWYSYQVLAENLLKLNTTNLQFTRWVVELQQNLYFVGLVLTYVLWGAMVKVRENRARLIQVVLALGVYFSAFAAYYALRNNFPQLRPIIDYIPPLMAVGLPLAWFVTFVRIPEEARLATARVVPALKHR
jgi:hypothetical protein